MLNLSCLSIKAEILGIYERKISIVFPEVLIFVNFLYSSLRYMILHFVPFLSYLTCSSYLLGSTSCPVRPFFSDLVSYHGKPVLVSRERGKHPT